MRVSAEHKKNYHITSNFPTTTDARRALEEDRNEHPDWIVITAFYQALHWVDAFLLTKGDRPVNHITRKKYIGKHKELEEIEEDYWRLSRASQMARYKKQTYRDDPDEFNEMLDISCSIINYIKDLMNIE